MQDELFSPTRPNLNPTLTHSNTASETGASTSHCDLLGLPAEIRNSIWQLTITMQRNSDAFVLEWLLSNGVRFYGRVPGLLHTCRQIRHETQAMYWNQVTIYNSFECPTKLAAAILTLEEVAIANLKTVQLGVRTRVHKDARMAQRAVEYYRDRLSGTVFRGKVEVYVSTGEMQVTGMQGFTSDPKGRQNKAEALLALNRLRKTPLIDGSVNVQGMDLWMVSRAISESEAE